MDFYRRASRLVAGLDLILVFVETFILLWNMSIFLTKRWPDSELIAKLVLITLGIPPLKMLTSIVLFMATLRAMPLLSAIHFCNVWMCLNIPLTCLLIFAVFIVGYLINLAEAVVAPLIIFKVTLVVGVILHSAAMELEWKFQKSLMSAIPTTAGAIPLERFPPRTPTNSVPRRRVTNGVPASMNPA